MDGETALREKSCGAVFLCAESPCGLSAGFYRSPWGFYYLQGGNGLKRRRGGQKLFPGNCKKGIDYW